MSDEEEVINPEAHKQLLQSIGNLVRTQHIRKSTRNEPRLHQDEFQLHKDADVISNTTAASANHSGRLGDSVAVNDVVQLLQSSEKHLDAGKQLKLAATKKKTLKRPLEKPIAQHIKRTIGYENTKKKLARWDAIVAKNRCAEQQVFPLKSETIFVNVNHGEKRDYKLHTSFMKELNTLEKNLEIARGTLTPSSGKNKEEKPNLPAIIKKKMIYKDILAKRRMLAYVRMKESQKSAKARIQNKIKSKKFHKLLKQQKLKEQIRQFELLQKTDPEAALEKLDALERSRILERANLRHKNTGSWAKNSKIRAKYNKEARHDFAEQLQLSRQLTQKNNLAMQASSDDDDDENNENDENDFANDEIATTNPWSTVARNCKSNDEKNVSDGYGNWRKYWLERNKNEKELKNYLNHNTNQTDENKEAVEVKSHIKIDNKTKTNVQQKTNDNHSRGNLKTEHPPEMNNVISTVNGWIVEDIPPNQNIDDIFDSGEYKLQKKLRNKLQKIKTIAAAPSNPASNKKTEMNTEMENESNAIENVNSLMLKNEIKRPVIDEALKTEETMATTQTSPLLQQSINLLRMNATSNANLSSKVDSSKQSHPASSKKDISIAKDNPSSNLNQYDILEVKHNAKNFNNLTSAVAGEINASIVDDEFEGEAGNEQQLTIAEAFEDDDIVADFARTKQEDTKLKDTEIEINPPGWGSWAGAGIPLEQTNKNRYLKLHIEQDKEEQRQDANKSSVYINEEPSKHLREHLVSEVPFPFTSVKDYQASIRAPIGRNYIPETAFRTLIRPSVITRKGQVIAPMDDSELLKKPIRPRNLVDKRIASMQIKKKA